MHHHLIFLTTLLLSVAAAGQTTTTGTGSKLPDSSAQQILAHHNKARAEVGIPPMKWSTDLATYAQAWADRLVADNCAFRHRQDSPHGENIFAASGGPSFNPLMASENWYAEKAKYTYSRVGEGNWQQTGHYTQMIWKGSTALGVGMATCANGNVVVVANYSPAGNMSGSFPY